MIRNYFKIAWRNLWRNKFFSIIKIVGLSIGLMVCILIFLYTKDEISYDQFHEIKAHLYRIIQTWQVEKDADKNIGTTNAILGETFAGENEYRITIGPGVFIFSTLIAIVITVATVSYQGLKAAMANPVKSLRSE